MNIIGRTPINPIIFYSGKLTGYAVWGVWVLSATGVADFSTSAVPKLQHLTALIVNERPRVNLSQRLGLPGHLLLFPV